MIRPRAAIVLTFAIVLASLACPIPRAAAQPQPAEDLTEMPRTEGPLKVSLGLMLIDFARISAREETFDLHGYLLASWHDPRLARDPGGSKPGIRRVKAGSVWSPEFEFLNATDQVKYFHENPLLVDDDGDVTRWIHFSGKFAWPMDVRKFPFDTQTLVVIVEPADRPASQLELAVDQKRVGKAREAFLTDWDIRDVSAVTILHEYPAVGVTRSRFRFEVELARRSTFYVWRVLLPFTLLVVASWAIYWFEPVGLQPQISTALSILLSVVVFNFSTDFALPKVTYLTFIDRHAITSFAFVFLNVIMVAIIHQTVQKHGPGRALAIQRTARWALPLAYVVTVLLGHVSS